MRHARSVRLAASVAPESPQGAGRGKPPPSEDAIEIWTDGACRGNPGPGGWGVLLRSGQHVREMHGGELETTNNRMELTAVIEALAALKRASRIVVHTDSQYVQLGITEWLPQWRKRDWKTAARKPVKNVDLWQRLAELVAQHRIDWRWVPGHAGVEGNERADSLANKGIDEVLARRR